MIHPSWPVIGLLFLIGYAAAAHKCSLMSRNPKSADFYHQQRSGNNLPLMHSPDADLWPQVVRSSACQEHTNLHKRLDVVEKRVENTVEKLESELAALLEAIDAPQWRPLLENTGEKTVDILQDPVERGQS